MRKHFNEFERPVSSVRSVFARRIKFFEAKHEGTFNANRSRQSRLPLIKRIHVSESFLFVNIIDYNERQSELCKEAGARVCLHKD